MTKISLIIHTASPDNFLEKQGIKSYFEAVTDNLCHQTFKEFEFIFVDRFFEQNEQKFNNVKRPFVIKHVPIHNNHGYWKNLGYTYISAAKNTGILYSDSILCISMDDAEFLPDHLLNTYWNHYQGGHLMHALHKRMKTIETKSGLVNHPIKGDVYINDNRFSQLTSSIKYHQIGSWTYAGTSFALEDALKINGFNERMDGCKSLEDCDFGYRLIMSGKVMSMDTSGFLYIVDHPSYCDITTGPDAQMTEQNKLPSLKKIDNLIAVENYGMLRCDIDLHEIEANKHPITNKHLEIIQRETLKYRNFDPLLPENKEKLDIWLGCPTFDLRKEREELRRNNEWRW